MEHWIVVGAGSAGCVVASRLSEHHGRQVTLLDDGPDLLPGHVPAGVRGPNFFEAMDEVGRTHSELLARRTPAMEPSLYQRGRGVGGSSAVNAMVALRGNPEIYAEWGWRDVDDAWARVAIPAVAATPDEIGAVSQTLLDASDDARPAELTRHNGMRVTSAEAYLWPALDRPNLTVRADSAVASIRIDPDKRATGVRLADGAVLDADHVVLCAGAIHSPALLLGSGITTPGIGHGLQDHPAVVFTLKLKPHVAQDPHGLAISAVAEIKVQGDFGNDLIQLLPMDLLGIGPDVAGLGAVMVALMTPTSRAGTVTIDADGAPVIDFRLLAEDRDVQALSAGVTHALAVLSSDPFAAVIDEIYIDDVGTTVAALDGPEAIASWIRTRGADYVHASSTCAIGTVVDDRFAVVGYENLFVCDASVFPTIPDVNTHLPTTMVAERFCLQR